MPMLVAAGAAGTDVGERFHHQPDFFGRFAVSSWRFG